MAHMRGATQSPSVPNETKHGGGREQWVDDGMG